MINCDSFFSPYRLGHWSLETELYTTQLCVPNVLKLVVYISYVMIYSAVIAYTLSLYRRYKRAINYWVYSLNILSALTHVIFNLTLLAGVENRVRFIAVSFYSGAFALSVAIYTSYWYQFIMDSITQISSKEKQRFNLIYTVGFYLTATTNILNVIAFPLVGSVMYYNIPAMLNLFFVLTVSVGTTAGIMMCLTTAYIAHYVLKICSPLMTDDFIKADSKFMTLINNIRNNYKISVIMAVAQLFMVIAPVSYYAASPSHNINGVFYFYYFFVHPGMVIGLISQIYVVTYGDITTNNSSKDSNYDSVSYGGNGSSHNMTLATT